jgi:hypothetical protein
MLIASFLSGCTSYKHAPVFVEVQKGKLLRVNGKVNFIFT